MIYPKPPNSIDPLPRTHITTDQLFTLPRIPYFYSVTPFPLAVATTLNLPSEMKRRYTSDDRDPNDSSSLPSRRYEGTYDIRSAQQEQQTQQQGSQQELSEGAGADDDIDHLGVDMIEGRVLKKMKRIKLTSESPPSGLSDMFTPQLDTHALGNAIWSSARNGLSTSTTSPHQQLSTQLLSSDSLRPFAPIKISTRSSSRQEPVASFLATSSSTSASSSTHLAFRNGEEERAKADAILPRADDGTDATIYAGMNTLLHLVHASRFGIPDELPPADDGRTLPGKSGSGAPVARQHLQNTSQAVAANTAWQQHQQQQPTRIVAANTVWSQQPSGSSTNTAWYQQQQKNAISTAQNMDEDDEMADVNETQGFSASFSAPGYQIPQGMNANLIPPQGYVLSQHLSHQQQQHQHHQQHQQPLQQRRSEQNAEEHNLYHTINSQLRAAFLARSEMDKRYQ
ncbi:hypothetical protein BGZ47_010521 [Haplosporangium gracile]|nr:hypothetical protein BGZ47_010521 [Haplosporangium gracile]